MLSAVTLVTILGVASGSPVRDIPPTSHLNMAAEGAKTMNLTKRASFPWPACQQYLCCSFDQIQDASFLERQTYMAKIQAQFTVRLSSPTQFKNIEQGLLKFFADKGQAKPGTCVSYALAGLIQSIQNGAASALGTGSGDGGNQGSPLWAQFFKAMSKGSYPDRTSHDKAWSQCEQAGTEFGLLSALKAGASSNVQIQRWQVFMKMYRALMQNEGMIKTIFTNLSLPLSTILPKNFDVGSFIDRFFDVTSPNMLYCGSDATLGLTGFESITVSTPSFFTQVAVVRNTLTVGEYRAWPSGTKQLLEGHMG